MGNGGCAQVSHWMEMECLAVVSVCMPGMCGSVKACVHSTIHGYCNYSYKVQLWICVGIVVTNCTWRMHEYTEVADPGRGRGGGGGGGGRGG